MTPRFLIKLATKEPEVYIPPRVVPPLAQIKAQQLNIPLQWLLHGNMTDVMNHLTNSLKNGDILNKTGSAKVVPDYTGMASWFAKMHRIYPITDIKSKMFKILNSDYVQGVGYRGACDAIAALRAAVDPNVIKGTGEKSLSMTKDKDIASNTISPGRNGFDPKV